jgi:hypothetical protein
METKSNQEAEKASLPTLPANVKAKRPVSLGREVVKGFKGKELGGLIGGSLGSMLGGIGAVPGAAIGTIVGSIVGQNGTPKALEWTEQEVKKWSEEKKIPDAIKEKILPCDGKLLNQFYLMQIQAPEFFFSAMSEDGRITIKELAKFLYELKLIF